MQFDVWTRSVKLRVVATFAAHGNCVASMEVYNQATNFDLLRPQCDDNMSSKESRNEIDRQGAIMLQEVYEKSGDNPKTLIPRTLVSRSRSHARFPTGSYSEEAQESLNKILRSFREAYTRITSRKESNQDLFNTLSATACSARRGVSGFRGPERRDGSSRPRG